MTEEELVIHIDPRRHPELYQKIRENMRLFNCSTYPQLLEIMFNRAALRHRVRQDMIEFLKDMGFLEKDQR